MSEITRHLIAQHLDEAGVKDWYGRLYRARRADDTGRAFDREWAAVKREYYAATGTQEPPEPSPVVRKGRENAERAYPNSRMLSYDEALALGKVDDPHALQKDEAS